MTSFTWSNQQDSPIRLRTFLRQNGVSRTLLKQIKFEGGKIVVNGAEEKVNYMLAQGDEVTITLPPEPANDIIAVSNLPINILYEDDHFLVVDKPAHVACLPSHLYKNDTIANRVKGYFLRQDYDNQKIHIVNRLDMDTSGIIIFAKHHFAHSVLDKQMQHHQIEKMYVAIVENPLNDKHLEINLPIERQPGSFIKRCVMDGGKPSKTEAWMIQNTPSHSLVKIKLHSGRTHQIRVHFEAIGHPLIGDWLYNPDNHELDRQALHCYKMKFYNPFTQQDVVCESKIPTDMSSIIQGF
ncbi:RluA family pseudouridine synthase [Lactobacillus kunkeei]|nr:RluA family pseudouridine synthase [Apilactobacillus kunkeei]